MHSLKQIWCICKVNFYLSITSFRFYFALLVVGILLIQIIKPIRDFSEFVQIPITPYLFPFLIQNRFLQTIIAIGLVFILSDVPVINDSTIYLVVRSSRRNWIKGQMLYIVLESFAFLICVVVLTIIILFPHLAFSIEWGKGISTLAQTNAAEQFGGNALDYHMMTAFTPLEAMFFSILVSWTMGIFIGLLIMAFNCLVSSITLGPLMGGLITLLPQLAVNFSDLHLIYFFAPPTWMDITLFRLSYESKLPTLPYVICFFLIMYFLLFEFIMHKVKRIDL